MITSFRYKKYILFITKNQGEYTSSRQDIPPSKVHFFGSVFLKGNVEVRVLSKPPY